MADLHVDVVQDDLQAGVQRRVGIVVYEGGLIVKEAFGPHGPLIWNVARQVVDQGDALRTLQAFAGAIEGRSIFATEPHTWLACPFGSMSQVPLRPSDAPFRVPA